ncbi:MAG: peptidyl-prolyl cis-trans isomerase [Akkermansiaceae bacterium]
MIENIRKYTGLMIVVLVLLFVGLVFLDGGVSKAFNGKPVMEVADHSISEKEFRRQRALMQLPSLLPDAFEIPRDSQLLASHYLGDTLIDSQLPKTPSFLVRIMASYLQPSVEEPERFIANRINVRKAGVEFGVTPSNDEVEKFVENVLFVDPEGNPDQEAYSEFIKNRVSAIGGNRGFNDYIRDLLTAQNLSKILGGGISTEMSTETALFDVQKQVITGSKITLETGVYEGKAKPTEEQLKAFFEENKGNYNSDELRKISYTLIEPNWDKALEEFNAAKAKTDAEEAEKKKKLEEAKKKADEIRKKAEEAARKANEANTPTAEPEPVVESSEPETATTTPAKAPALESTPPAETTETTPATPEGDGSQGDPGEPGEPAPAPTPAPVDSSPLTTEASTTENDLGSGLNEALEDVTTGSAETNPLTTLPTPTKPVTPPKPETPKTAKEQLDGAAKQKAVEALSEAVNDFYQKLADNEGEDFEAISKDSGYEIIKSEFFTKADPPKELSAFIDNLQIGKIADAAFQLPENGDPDEKLSLPYRTSDGWFLIRLDEVEDSLPLSYEEAKVQVTVDLKKKMAREQMIKDANELHTKLTEAIKSGKTFADAAKELEKEAAEVKEITEGQTFNFGQRSQKMPDPPEFTAAQYTNAGEITSVQFTPSEEEATQALIVFVEKREVVKSPEYQTDLNQRYESISGNMRFVALSNWLYDRYAESEVVPPKREDQE